MSPSGMERLAESRVQWFSDPEEHRGAAAWPLGVSIVASMTSGAVFWVLVILGVSWI